MTMSYKKSRSGGYYTACMTAEQLNAEGGSRLPGHRVDDYYSGTAKEPPGQWYFAPDHTGRRGDFGLEDGKEFGEGDVDAYHALCNGINPQGGPKLVQNAGDAKRIALHDFTFSAHKSFSAVWSQSDEAGRLQIQEAQRASVREAMDFFASKGAWTRQGKGGHIKTKTSFVGAIFEHGSSRADDPLLHTHATVLNVCRRPDGSTGAIETVDALRWQGAVASMYHAGLAHRFRELGAAIKLEGKIPEVDGVPLHVVEAFSRRRKAIEAAVERHQLASGMTADASRASRGLLQKAWNETRDAKNELTREELERQWMARGRELGFSEVEVKEVMSLGEPLEEWTGERLMEEARQAVANLTETDATFSEPALYTCMAVHLCGRASVAQIQQAVEAIQPELIHTNVLTNAEKGEVDKVYSTKEMLAIERDLLKRVVAKAPQHKLDSAYVEQYIESKDEACLAAARKSIEERGGNPADAAGLANEQKLAMIYATQTDNQVVVIEGTAGAGKTFTAESIAAMHRENGYEVHGLSGAWAQALNLQREAKLDTGRAIAGWLNDIRQDKLVLDPKSVVILDEAGMVGSKDLRNVVRAVQDAGAKLILLGDTLQQSAVSAGDALRITTAEIGSARLDEIRRQRDADDRKSVHEFFAGHSADALARYEAKGRVHIAANVEETQERLIADWMASRQAHPNQTHLILALDNASVDELNRLAHTARKDAGELGDRSVQLNTMSSKDQTDLLEFTEGDRVVFRVNNRGMATADKESEQLLAEYRADIKQLAAVEAKLTKVERRIASIEREQVNEAERQATAQRRGEPFMARSFDDQMVIEQAELVRIKQEISDHLAGVAKRHEGSQNVFAVEVRKTAFHVQADKGELDGARMSTYFRSHATDIERRIKDAEVQRAGEVFNRVRGTIEQIDDQCRLTVRTEDGKLVTIDPADTKWQHKSKDGKAQGLGIQHDYASSVYASQGLTRDRVFVKDHFGLGRKQAGVAFSRHREDCQLYVDKEARYEAKMRETAADDWHHISEFSDEECIGRMKTSYSRLSGKTSTTDFDVWRDYKEVKIDVEMAVTSQQLREMVDSHRLIKPVDAAFAAAIETTGRELPFQRADWYALPDRDKPSYATVIKTRDQLADAGISANTIIEAERQGFTSYDSDGNVSFVGRRGDGAVVNRITHGERERGPLRGNYPPILRGDTNDVRVVSDGNQALRMWRVGRDSCEFTPKAT